MEITTLISVTMIVGIVCVGILVSALIVLRYLLYLSTDGGDDG